MANPLAIELHASGAEAASGTSDVVDMGATRTAAKLSVIMESVSGTDPALAVVFQFAPTETGPWKDKFSVQQNSSGKRDVTVAEVERYARARWVIGGTDTPTFTFSISGFAHTLYASPSDLTKTGISSQALEESDAVARAECCLRATSDAETALNSSYEMPIDAWGEDLRGHVAARAVFYVMNHRGRKPGAGNDRLIDMMGGFRMADTGAKSAAQEFFDSVAAGRLKPVGIVDQTPDEYEGAGVVVSGTRRGW